MDRRMRKYGGVQASPERAKARPEAQPPPRLPPGRKLPVVYYLCRNHQLEHPHFMEVPLSFPDGLYLRDVTNRLNALRGRRMAARYSWSCKRSYKNGFVWHDLSEDDLVLPAHGNEYILKGSELLDQSPQDRAHRSSGNGKALVSYTTQEASSSPSSPLLKTETKESRPLLSPLPPSPPSQEGELSTPVRFTGSSGNVSPEPGSGSPASVEYRVSRINAAADASTQTEDKERSLPRCVANSRMQGVSTEDAAWDIEFRRGCHNRASESKEESENTVAEISPAPTSSSTSSFRGKTGTLGSLIRADVSKMNSFRILEEEEVFVPTKTRLKAVDMLMQLITCGAISVKGHQSFGLIPTYKPIFSNMNRSPPTLAGSMMMGEIDRPLDNSRLMRPRMQEKEYFSGSLIEAKKHKEEVEKRMPTLKRSSSYNEERTCYSPNPVDNNEKEVDLTPSKCLPRAIKITASKRNDTITSPISDCTRKSSPQPDFSPSATLHSSNGGSNRITDNSSVKGSSLRLESPKEQNEMVFVIEERLTSGARVIIQSTAPCRDGDYSSSCLY